MEDSFVITGGRKLEGNIKLSGAKNVALKVIIASLMFDEEVILKNIPRILDVIELLNLIKSLGGKADFIDQNTVSINGHELKDNKVDLLYASKIRVSFMFFAPLLYKFGRCYVPNPGGCRIGARPIDRTIDGMKKLGIHVEYDSKTGYYEATMPDKPSGNYKFNKSSHTGTEMLMLLALFGKSEIIIENAAVEPEIDDLINFLNQSGASISKSGNKLHIKPVAKLHTNQPYTIIPDRNEAVTFISMVCATRGAITLENINPQHLTSYAKKLTEAGVTINNTGEQKMYFSTSNPLKSVNVETSPHPGFMTDWQPSWAILMTQAQGESTIYERVFENRFAYVEELRKLGAEIDFIKAPVINPSEYFFFNFDPSKKYNQAIRIKGPQKLHGGALNIADLRAGATLVEAAIIAEGESIINNASILERGYENFVEKVKSLGGNIKKI